MLKPYVRYLSYVLRHKWYVARACFARGLYWRGLVHDVSKLRPCEFVPYARYFYGPRRDASAFDLAWLRHQKLNPHHWQWWLLPEDDGGTKRLPMPPAYRLEMLCDWIGAGLAQGKPDTAAWYRVNRNKMQLHPETRAWVERELAVLRDGEP